MPFPTECYFAINKRNGLLKLKAYSSHDSDSRHGITLQIFIMGIGQILPARRFEPPIYTDHTNGLYGRISFHLQYNKRPTFSGCRQPGNEDSIRIGKRHIGIGIDENSIP